MSGRVLFESVKEFQFSFHMTGMLIIKKTVILINKQNGFDGEVVLL